MKKVTAFNAGTQKDEPHTVEVVNGEIVFTAPDGRFFKTPIMKADEMKAYLAKHKKDNTGQIPATPVMDAKESEELLNEIFK